MKLTDNGESMLIQGRAAIQAEVDHALLQLEAKIKDAIKEYVGMYSNYKQRLETVSIPEKKSQLRGTVTGFLMCLTYQGYIDDAVFMLQTQERFNKMIEDIDILIKEALK